MCKPYVSNVSHPTSHILWCFVLFSLCCQMQMPSILAAIPKHSQARCSCRGANCDVVWDFTNKSQEFNPGVQLRLQMHGPWLQTTYKLGDNHLWLVIILSNCKWKLHFHVMMGSKIAKKIYSNRMKSRWFLLDHTGLAVIQTWGLFRTQRPPIFSRFFRHEESTE